MYMYMFKYISLYHIYCKIIYFHKRYTFLHFLVIFASINHLIIYLHKIHFFYIYVIQSTISFTSLTKIKWLLCSNQICMQQLVATKLASCLFAATLQLLSVATGSQSNYSQSVAASSCHKQEDSKNSFFII